MARWISAAATDVVVALDRDGLLALGTAGFDHVGVDRALREPSDSARVRLLDLRGLGLEDLDELPADDLALLLGIRHARELAQEQVARIDAHDLRVQLAGEHVHDHVAFVQPQQAVVDEHAGELVADGAVDQRGRDRRIDAARQAEDHLFTPDLFTDPGDRFFDVVPHDPVGLCAADAEHEALEDRLALHGVRHFGVELQRVVAARLVGHACDGAAVGAGHELEARRQFGDLVAMAHPHVEHAVAFGRGEVRDVFQQRGVAMGAHGRKAELALVAAFDLAAELMRHGLHAVADAEHGHAEVEYGLRALVGGFFVHAGMAARQDHALEMAVGRVFAHPFVGDVAGMHLAEHMGFAHAACNQLRDLRAEVEDEDLVVLHGRWDSER